jgi:hypothetical protein
MYLSAKERAAVNARLAAEDRIFEYLAHKKWSPETSITIATRVEFFLAVLGEDEQEDMRRRRDPREVVQISLSNMREVRRAFGGTAPGNSDAAAEQHVIDLLSKFPPDRAWWIAHKVRKSLAPWLEMRSRRERAPASA